MKSRKWVLSKSTAQNLDGVLSTLHCTMSSPTTSTDAALLCQLTCPSCAYVKWGACSGGDHGLWSVPVLGAAGASSQQQHLQCSVPSCGRSSLDASAVACPQCAAAMTPRQVRVSKEEAQYGVDTFVPSLPQDPLPHSLLHCSKCFAIGFPGSHGKLTLRDARGGLVAMAGPMEGTDRPVASWAGNFGHDKELCDGAASNLELLAVNLPRDEVVKLNDGMASEHTVRQPRQSDFAYVAFMKCGDCARVEFGGCGGGGDGGDGGGGGEGKGGEGYSGDGDGDGTPHGLYCIPADTGSGRDFSEGEHGALLCGKWGCKGSSSNPRACPDCGGAMEAETETRINYGEVRV